MNTTDRLDKDAKLRLFRECFTGRQDVYGTYDPVTGRTWQVKAPVTDRVLLDHLAGRKPYGVYLLVGDRTRAIVADFDWDDIRAPIQFIAEANHYGIAAYIERSKSKGHHVWTFFPSPGVSARKARLVVQYILREIGMQNVEVFPKQDALEPEGKRFGSFVNAPLFGGLVRQGRTVFLDPQNAYRPYENQWSFLSSAERMPETRLDETIEVNELEPPPAPVSIVKQGTLGVFRASSGLPPCARRMLEQGVSENQRVACFRLAVHLRRIGLPFDVAVAALQQWATKNRPQLGKRVITLDEIKAQAASAFLKEYHGNGCEDPTVQPFCDPSCPVRNSVSGAGARAHGQTHNTNSAEAGAHLL